MPARKKPATDGAEPKPARRTSKPKTDGAVSKGATTRRKKAEPAPAEGSAPVDPRKQDLVIVESPAKAKTINKYLGPGFKVLASYGHVRDLPRSGKQKGEDVIGISIADHWRMRYVVQDKHDDGKGGKSFNRKTQKDIIDELKREANRSNRVFLASDPDREGEAIAWHIADELKLDDARTFRIRFNEITRSAVQQALGHAEKIDMDRVKAQEARRALDRVVGYPLSDLLGLKVTRGLSAGRVQSVAVRLIVDREREIEAFKTEEFWKVTALLAPQGTVRGYVADPTKVKVFAKKKGDDAKEDAAKDEAPKPEAADGEAAKEAAPTGGRKVPAGAFLAELARWNGAEFKTGSGATATNEAAVDQILAALQGVTYTVTKIEQKDRAQRPSAPFTTSTLQQQAFQRLHFSSSRTMQTAQKLYEGIDLGSEGSIALITYMRTDSTRVSDDALKAVRAHILAEHGQPYVPDKPNLYASGKSAQEAHEAIRPTDVAYTPQRVQPHLSQEQYRLYKLIYDRFVASQMSPAIDAITNVEVTAGPGVFKAQGKIEKFDGFRRVLPPAKQEDVMLPKLQANDVLDKLDLFGSQHFTQPPPRYNEASLVKALEKEGIGRPSTYASIISTIQKRGYVEQEHHRFKATTIGKVVTDLLVQHFPRIMDLKFTSHFEEELDEIETGKMQYEAVLNEFWDQFSGLLTKARTDMPAQKGVETGEKCPKCGRALEKRYSAKTRGEFIGCSGFRDKENPCRYIKPREGEPERPEPVETEFKCPTCTKPMIKRYSPKSGEFLGCSGYPECKTTMNIGADGQPVLASKPTEHKCPKCGSAMVLREGRRGPFLSCSAYPKCKTSMEVDANGNPVKPVDTGEVCEKCNQPMVIKRGPRGPFLSCSGYPKCRNAKPLSAELKERLKDQLPAPPPKKAQPAVEISETCPECGSPMKVRRGFKGPFLGCSKYPKCKGTREATPELLEKLQEAGAM